MTTTVRRNSREPSTSEQPSKISDKPHHQKITQSFLHYLSRVVWLAKLTSKYRNMFQADQIIMEIYWFKMCCMQLGHVLQLLAGSMEISSWFLVHWSRQNLNFSNECPFYDFIGRLWITMKRRTLWTLWQMRGHTKCSQSRLRMRGMT